jgi:hypothetical protein
MAGEYLHEHITFFMSEARISGPAGLGKIPEEKGVHRRDAEAAEENTEKP